jgi:hypothetical protein
LEINNKVIIHHTTNIGKKIERERFVTVFRKEK